MAPFDAAAGRSRPRFHLVRRPASKRFHQLHRVDHPLRLPAQYRQRNRRRRLRQYGHNLKPEQTVQLKELLAANQSLLCVYVLCDEFKRLWFHRKPAWAGKAWGQWFEQAQQSGIAALQKFTERLQGYWHGIVTRCRHPLNTSVVEGINNTIKVIKRRAYGYRDEEYFFLKIRAAVPGISR
nr:transposase [Burkholderia pyrrocinia]